ncbi:uncharacterized protein LOC143297931 isoform X2 [Babylonia areolata]|uniref:uncharacterized protein LOC143297931 isoform X2 n=1 Tax=Babylonia areolata TaxID=304850 RepID=UPI003FD692D9
MADGRKKRAAAEGEMEEDELMACGASCRRPLVNQAGKSEKDSDSADTASSNPDDNEILHLPTKNNEPVFQKEILNTMISFTPEIEDSNIYMKEQSASKTLYNLGADASSLTTNHSNIDAEGMHFDKKCVSSDGSSEITTTQKSSPVYDSLVGKCNDQVDLSALSDSCANPAVAAFAALPNSPSHLCSPKHTPLHERSMHRTQPDKNILDVIEKLGQRCPNGKYDTICGRSDLKSTGYMGNAGGEIKSDISGGVDPFQTISNNSRRTDHATMKMMTQQPTEKEAGLKETTLEKDAIDQEKTPEKDIKDMEKTSEKDIKDIEETSERGAKLKYKSPEKDAGDLQKTAGKGASDKEKTREKGDTNQEKGPEKNANFQEKIRVKDYNLQEKTPEKDITIQEKGPEKKAIFKEKTPEKEDNLQEKTPEKEDNLQEKTPEKEDNPQDKTLEKEGNLQEKTPKEDVAGQEKGPEKDLNLQGKTTEKDPNSREKTRENVEIGLEKTPGKNASSQENGPEKNADGPQDKDAKLPEKAQEQDTKSQEEPPEECAKLSSNEGKDVARPINCLQKCKENKHKTSEQTENTTAGPQRERYDSAQDISKDPEESSTPERGASGTKTTAFNNHCTCVTDTERKHEQSGTELNSEHSVEDPEGDMGLPEMFEISCAGGSRVFQTNELAFSKSTSQVKRMPEESLPDTEQPSQLLFETKSASEQYPCESSQTNTSEGLGSSESTSQAEQVPEESLPDTEQPSQLLLEIKSLSKDYSSESSHEPRSPFQRNASEGLGLLESTSQAEHEPEESLADTEQPSQLLLGTKSDTLRSPLVTERDFRQALSSIQPASKAGNITPLLAPGEHDPLPHDTSLQSPSTEQPPSQLLLETKSVTREYSCESSDTPGSPFQTNTSEELGSSESTSQAEHVPEESLPDTELPSQLLLGTKSALVQYPCKSSDTPRAPLVSERDFRQALSSIQPALKTGDTIPLLAPGEHGPLPHDTSLQSPSTEQPPSQLLLETKSVTREYSCESSHEPRSLLVTEADVRQALSSIQPAPEVGNTTSLLPPGEHDPLPHDTSLQSPPQLPCEVQVPGNCIQETGCLRESVAQNASHLQTIPIQETFLPPTEPVHISPAEPRGSSPQPPDSPQQPQTDSRRLPQEQSQTSGVTGSSGHRETQRHSAVFRTRRFACGRAQCPFSDVIRLRARQRNQRRQADAALQRNQDLFYDFVVDLRHGAVDMGESRDLTPDTEDDLDLRQQRHSLPRQILGARNLMFRCWAFCRAPGMARLPLQLHPILDTDLMSVIIREVLNRGGQGVATLCLVCRARAANVHTFHCHHRVLCLHCVLGQRRCPLPACGMPVVFFWITGD